MEKGYMYILKCANGEFYTGSTNNLERRIEQHHNGEGSNFSWKYLPVQLVYHEEFLTVEQAFKREKQIQNWSHAKKKALIQGDFEKLKALSKNHTEYKRRGLKKYNPFEDS